MDDIFDEICTFENLCHATHKAMRGKRLQTKACRFYSNLENEVFTLQDELLSGRYVPRPLQTFVIKDPKERVISCSDFRDRVVHHAIFNKASAWFERRFVFHTYACRPGKGTHRAIKQAQVFCRKYPYFLKCDISKYFPSIQHNTLKKILAKVISSERLLNVFDTIIDHGSSRGVGLPIGNLSSQYFANLYLGELDLFIKNDLRVKGYLRYMDDFILFADSKVEANRLLESVTLFLRTHLQLTLNKRVFMISPCRLGLPFLGFNIFPKLIRIKRSNLIRIRKKMKRCTGENPTDKEIACAQSLIAHIKQANTYSLRVKEFATE
jgi:RNA-directed DNA polymerase